jgi:hypothetical protein
MDGAASKHGRGRQRPAGDEQGPSPPPRAAAALAPGPVAGLVVGLGDAMLDLIVDHVPHARLRELGIEPGGCVQVPVEDIDALLSALGAGGGGGGKQRPEG